jgi:hypothetical protein
MKLLFIITFFISVKTFAFPDTIRHGYTNCTSCHVSPSGGGMLNCYGRSLSRELLSTWGSKNEESLFHGLVKMPEGTLDKFLLGGDARYISRRQKNQTSKIDEGFWMQAQLRLGLVYEKFKFLMAIGKIENPRASQEVEFVSPEFYGIYSPQESLHIRAGRFEPVFGLRMPDHNLWIKSDIGFVPWNEREGVELIYEGETQFLSLAGFQSTSAVNPGSQTTGYSFTMDQVVFDTTRMGISAMNAEGQGIRQKVFGAHGTIGWTEKLFTMLGYSQIWNLENKKDVLFFRTGYEIYKGLTPFIQTQGRFDKIDNTNDQKKHGLGLIWLPRPHFELVFQIEKTQSERGDSDENYLLFHYYL